MFATTRDFLYEVATGQPLLICLEDLHWADQASLDFLRAMGRGTANQRILIAATYRSDELHRQHPLYIALPILVRESRAERVELRPLDDDATRTLIRHRYALIESDEQRLERYLRERAEGNAFYALELLRSLEDTGVLAQKRGEWVLHDLTSIRLPTLLQQVIESRLARLGEETKSLLQVAAMIGQDVSLDLWQQVSNTDDAALAAAIEQGERAQLLTEAGTDGRYRFRHALIREALYHEVILIRRRVWHRRIAEALLHHPAPNPDQVAYHFQHAGDERASEWLIRAGERAQRSYVWLAAAERFEAALALLPDEVSRARDRAWLQLRIGLLTRHFHGDTALNHLEDAARLAEIAGDNVLGAMALAHVGLVRGYDSDRRRGLRERSMKEMEAGVIALESLDEAQQHELKQIEGVLGATIGIQGRGTLAQWMVNQGQFHQAELMLEGRHNAGPVDDADAKRAAGMIWGYLGDPAMAHSSFTRARQCYEALNDPVQAGTDAMLDYVLIQLRYGADHPTRRQEQAQLVRKLWTDETGLMIPPDYDMGAQAFDLLLSGDWARATDVLDRYVPLTSSWFNPLHTSRLLLARYRGDSETVWSEIRRVLPDGPETEFDYHFYPVLDDLAQLAAEQALDDGNLEIARAWLETYDRLLGWSDAVLGRAEAALGWARYHNLHGEPSLARQHADQALAHATDPRQPLALIAVHRFIGHLDTVDQRFAAAEQHLQESLRLAEACEAPFERALTLLELAGLRLAQRQLDEATTLLDEVQATCEPLGAKPTLEQVNDVRTRIEQMSRRNPKLSSRTQPARG